MKKLIKDTKDLLKQAKTEKSHYYVASILQKWLEVAEHSLYHKPQKEHKQTFTEDDFIPQKEERLK